MPQRYSTLSNGGMVSVVHLFSPLINDCFQGGLLYLNRPGLTSEGKKKVASTDSAGLVCFLVTPGDEGCISALF